MWANEEDEMELWSPPPSSTLKFNVDGTTRGKPGPASI